MPQTSPEQLPQVKRELSPRDIILLRAFILICLEADIPFTLEFDTGRYIPGEFLFDADGKLLNSDDISDEHVVQEQQGLRIQVAGSSVSGATNGEAKLYPEVGLAVSDGLQILYSKIKDRQGEPAAKAAFSQHLSILLGGKD